MDSPKNNRQVVIWLYIGLVMIMIQVIIGGITRLTGSGLSITEWKPIIGAFPPMNEQAWQEAFNKYKEIAQFKHLNSHFTLEDFKFIFFWEWFQSVKHNSFFDMNDVVRTGLGALVGGCASLFFESQIIMIILLTVSATLVIKDLKK
jgi:hypothetical protein